MGKRVAPVPYRVFPGHQTGAALMTVLLLLALAATAAMGLTQLQKREIRRTANLIHQDQALALAKSGEQWAMGILRRHEELAKIDTSGKPWFLELPPVTSAEGTAKGRLEDLQSRFNLNNLVQHGAVDPLAVQRLQRLLTLKGLPADLVMPVLARLGANPAMQPEAPARFFTTADLLTWPGWNQETLAMVEPFLTALPGMGIPVNVNTASREVLMALSENMNPITAATLIAAREMKPFASTGHFMSHPAMAGKNMPEVGLTVTSDFFLVTVESRVGQGRVFLRSLLARSDQHVHVLARQEGFL